MTEIAKLFTTLGFKTDTKGLEAYTKEIEKLKKELQGLQDTFSGGTLPTGGGKGGGGRKPGKPGKGIDKTLQEIRANYAKVLPDLEKASKDLAKIQKKLNNPELSDAKSKSYQDAKGRVEKRINMLLDKEKKAKEALSKKEKAEIDKQFREKQAADKKWRDVKEKRDLEEWKLKGQKLRDEEAAKEKAQRKADQIQRQEEAKARRERSEARQAEKHKLALQKQAYDLENKKNTETRRAQLHELRMQQRINNARRRGRRSGKGYYRGAREYGRAFIPGIGGAFAAIESTQAYQDYQGMQSSLTMATGSSEQADQEIGFLTNLANRLGMFVGEMGKNYASLSANTKNTSLEGEGTRQVFEAVSSYARVLNLSKEDQSGVFRALSQMVGKGQIYAEELRQQMGERAPGALQAMARAAGYGDSEEGIAKFYEAVEAGQIKATEVFPKFSEELMKMANSGDALEKAMNNTAASIGRFKTNVWMANKTFNEAGYDRAVRDFFNTSSDAIQRAEPLWILMGRASVYLGKALEAPIELFGELASRLGFLTEEGFKLSTEFKVTAAAIIAFFKPLRKLFSVFVLLPMAISAVTDTLQNGFSGWDDFFSKMTVWAATAAGLLTTLKGFKTVLGAAVFQALIQRSIAPVGIGSTQSEEEILTMMNSAAARRDRLFSSDMQDQAAAWFQDTKYRFTGGGTDTADTIGKWWNAGMDRFGRMTGGLNKDLLDGSGITPKESFYQSHGIRPIDRGVQYVGDVHITVESPDPNLAGTKVEETFLNLFGRELRLASSSEQVNEK